jgi:uncharacterized protein
MAKWGKISSRGNVDDRRSNAPLAIGGLTLGGAVLYLLFNLITGGEVNLPLNGMLGSNTNLANTENLEFEGEDPYEVFASTVLGSNNDMWTEVFIEIQREYISPQLVLFRTSTESACGLPLLRLALTIVLLIELFIWMKHSLMNLQIDLELRAEMLRKHT